MPENLRAKMQTAAGKKEVWDLFKTNTDIEMCSIIVRDNFRRNQQTMREKKAYLNRTQLSGSNTKYNVHWDWKIILEETHEYTKLRLRPIAQNLRSHRHEEHCNIRLAY